MIGYLTKYRDKLLRGIRHKGLFGNGLMAALREKALFYQINHARDLLDFQKSDTCEVLKIIYKHYKNPKQITILDVGCNAVEAKYLAKHVKRVVGINIDKRYFGENSIPQNVELIIMDGTRLKFPEKTFDFIYSLNVCEHITDLSKLIAEQLRVLKDNGYCYAKWEPVWSSPRGHHIHDDMVRTWEKECKIETPYYKNDGKFIDDWSHLLLSKEEMFERLIPKIRSKELATCIVDYIYTSTDINRLFFDEVEKIFSEKNLRIVSWGKYTSDVPQDILNNLKKKYAFKDFSTRGNQILFAHPVSE